MSSHDATHSKIKVLIVEDRPDVLRFVVAQVQSLGYDVTAVTSGPEALHVLSLYDNFDLLFTDVMLPDGVSGIELAQRARRAFGRTLKVLLTSGYPDKVIEHDGEPNGLPLLQKPYKLEQLRQALHDALSKNTLSIGGMQLAEGDLQHS